MKQFKSKFKSVVILLFFSIFFTQNVFSASTEVQNGQAIAGLSASSGNWLRYKINVPNDATNLVMKINGNNGDADIYTKFGSEPSRYSWDCRPYDYGSNESCTVASPQTGYYYIGIRAYNSFSGLTFRASFETGGGNPNPGDETFGVSAVNDNLNNNDLYLMSDGLTGLGYSRSVLDLDATSSELINYLGQTLTTFYHTGHGFDGGISTSNGSITYNDVTLNVENTIIATCLTLKDTSWKNKFGSTAKTMSGYTKVSYDGTDDTVVNKMINSLTNGKTYPVAWYDANIAVSNVSDRWCVYSKEGSSIVEYSARTGNIPRSGGESFLDLDSASRLKVIKGLVIDSGSKIHKYLKITPGSLINREIVELTSFSDLVPSSLTKDEAIEKAKKYLVEAGEDSPNLVVDKVYPVGSDMGGSTYKNLGWVVRFIKSSKDGIEIRGNGTEAFKSLMLTGKGEIASFTMNWWDDSVMVAGRALALKSPMEVLKNAAEAIASHIKSNSIIKIVGVKPVYGIKKLESGGFEMVPSYGFKALDGGIIVVDAVSGEYLK